MAAVNALFYGCQINPNLSVWVVPPSLSGLSVVGKMAVRIRMPLRTFPRLETVPSQSLAEFYPSDQFNTVLLVGGVAGQRRYTFPED